MCEFIEIVVSQLVFILSGYVNIVTSCYNRSMHHLPPPPPTMAMNFVLVTHEKAHTHIYTYSQRRLIIYASRQGQLAGTVAIRRRRDAIINFLIVEHAKGSKKEPGQDGVSQVNEAAKPIRRNHWAAAEQAKMMNQLQSPCLATNDKVALRVVEAVGGVTEPVGGVVYGVRGAASHMSFVGLPHEHEQRVSLQRLMGGWLENFAQVGHIGLNDINYAQHGE